MVKVRKINSVEKAIQNIFKNLNEDEIRKAIKKSSSYLRKCGDDESPHKLQFEDAINLDIESIKKNGNTPLFDYYKYQISKSSALGENEEISKLVSKMQIALGTLTKEYIDSIEENSRGGEKITEDEKNRIYDEILNSESLLKKLKLRLEKSEN